ncbi:hypothetical protein PLESTF_000378700 [Pleodorina starrii]|nr:hypothetical protein PLESTF_000378700 [Pleodorina starrii]
MCCRVAYTVVVVQIQYFFEGPDESWSPPGASNESNGSSEPPFELKCSDTSAALPNRCGALAWLFSSGVPGVRGSRYVLALGFAPGSGNLAPQSANATNGTTSTNSTGGGETGAAAAGANPTGGAGGSESGSAVAGSEDEDIQLPAVELIISIEPTTPARMDARQDYSFLNTPILGQQQTSLKAPTSSGSAAPANASAGQGEGAPRIVMLRQRLPNPRIPAYVRGFIAWGSPPAPASQQPPEDLLPPPSEQQTSDMDALEEQLPPGSSCQKTPDGKLSCGVADSYCCATEGIIVTEVPPGWATIIAPPPSSPPPPPSSLPPPSPPPSPPPPPPPSSSAPSPDRPPLSSNGNVTARANGTGGGGGGNSARTAAIAVGVSLGTVALFLGVGLYAYLRPDCGGGRGHGGRGRRGDDVRRRFGRTAGGGWRLPHFAAFLLPAGLKRSDSAGSGASSGSSSSRSSSSSTSPSTSPSDSRSTGRSRGGDAHWRGVLRDLHRLQQQQPCLVSTNIHVTASEASELRYVLDAGWWQDNFASKGGPMGQQGLLPKYPTMPAEVFMAHVEALSPPTTRELREQLARGPICSGGGVGSQEGGGGVSGQGEGAGSEGVEGSGVQRKRSRAAAVAAAAAAAEAEAEGGRGWAAATLAAADLAGLDDDDIRLRILVRKAKTWTGRVDETWELLPDYPPHLLLPPMQQPEVAELELQAASVPDGQTAGEISGGAGAVPHPPQAPGAPLERTQPLLSRLLPRRRTLAAPMESPPAPSPPAALSKHHHHRRRPTLNRDMGAPSPGSPLAAGTTAAGIELQPRQPQAAQAQLHHHPGGPEPLGASRYITLDKVASLARGAGGGAGVAVLPGLPVSLSMAPIELDVDFETEVAPHLGRLVGVGGFGRVYEGTWRGRKVAVKTVTIDNEAQRQALAKEAQMCARFRNCERIVQLLGASLGLGPSAANSPPAGAGTGGVFRRTTRGGTEISSGGGAIPAAPAPDASAAFGSTTSRRGQGSSDGRGSSGAEPVPTGAETYATSGMGTPGRPAYQPTSRPAQQQQAGAQGQGHPGQQNAALIMELCEGGNLGGRIHHPHMRRLEYLEVLQLSRDVAEGLAHIHRFGVLHRDLKPGNVLLDSGGRAKIADFGISRLRDPYKSCVNVTQQGGTPNYMAPELFNGTRVDERADLYSLGCIMYEALTRKVPFDNLVRGPAAGQGPGGGEGGGGPDGMPAPLPMGGLFAIILAVAIQGRRPTLPDWVPRGLADLIAACWAENPRARPTAAQVYARLDALIAEELGRRAVRAARVGVSRPRVSRHYGGSGAALVPMASASSSGLSHRETNAAASMDVSTAGVHALPSPPPSPSMLPTPPALVSQSSSQPPQSQDSAGGGKGEAAAVPAPVSRGNERHDSYIPSSGSSAAIAAAAAARRPLQLSPRPRSGSTAVAELPLGSQLAPYIDPHPELLPGGELQLPQPPRSPDAAGRLARRQQLPRPPPSPPGRTALHPEPMSPRLDLPLPDYSKGSPKLQPVPPNLPPPPPLRPQDSSLPHRHQQEEQSEPPSKAPVPATSGSGRAGRSFAQMAAAVFGAATGGRGTSGSWFGGNSSATTTAGSVSASGGEEAALPPARGASRRVSPSLASPLAEPAPAALPLPPLQSDQRPRRSMGPLPAEVGAQAGLAAVAASALPSTASTSTQTSDSLDRSLSGLDALVNTTWTDGDVEGGRAVRAEAGPASEERRQRAALALRRSEAGAGAKAEDAADAAELAGRFFSARSRHDPQTSEDYCTVTEDEADTGEDSGPAGGSNGAPRRRRGSRHRSVQANTEDGGDGAGTSSGAVRGRSAAASPIGSSGGSASRSALWHGSDAHQPQQSLQHARMLASQPALYGAARLRDAADAAERGAVGDSAVAMGGRVGRGGEGGVAGMGRELTAGEGVSAPTGPGDCDGHHHRPLSGSHPQSSVSDDTGGGDDGGGQVNRSTGGGGGDGGGSLSGNVARWWPWWLFRRPTGDQQVAQAPQAQGSGPAARPQEGQPETHLAAGAHLRQPPARHAHRGPQHAYNQYPGNHRHPHQSSWNPEPEPPSRQPQPHPGHSRTVSTPCPAAAGSWPWPQSPAQQVQYHAAHLNGAAGAGQGVDGVGIPGDGGSGGGSGGTDAAPSVCGTGEPGPSRTTTDYTVASTRTLSSNAGLPYPYPYSPSAQPPSYRPAAPDKGSAGAK